MNDLTISCGCGRRMTLDTMRGRGAFRCGCGARIKFNEPEYRADRCVSIFDRRRCGKTATTEGPTPMCQEHLDETKVVLGLIRPEELEQFADLLAAAELEIINEGDLTRDQCVAKVARWRANREAARAKEWARFMGELEPYDVRGVVYFIRMGENIKIGTTINLRKRVAGLSLTMDHVMATEPGGHRREAELHQRFASLREHGEWFRPGPELLEYIAALEPMNEKRQAS